MPPKGWRKSADGSYPVPSKERDLISIDDILFPKATVNRLARAILDDGNIISKDSSTAIQRSATVFVSYLLVHAREHARKFDRRTIGPQDITNALVAAEFSSFLPTVKHELDTYQANKDALKQKRKEAKEKGATATENDTIEENDKQEGDEDQKNNDNGDDDDDDDDDEGDDHADDDDDESLEQLEEGEFEQPVSKKIKALTNASREDTVSEPETDQN